MPWHHSLGYTHACTDVHKKSADNTSMCQCMLTTFSSHSLAGDRDHAMTSGGICASVVSGAKILVCDRLGNRGVVIPDVGVATSSGGAGLLTIRSL